jgi:hypothetical protein
MSANAPKYVFGEWQVMSAWQEFFAQLFVVTCRLTTFRRVNTAQQDTF